MFCPRCGNELPDNAVFCGKCGSRVKIKLRQEDGITENANNEETFRYVPEEAAYRDDSEEEAFRGKQERKTSDKKRQKPAGKKSKLPLLLLLLLIPVLGASGFLIWQLRSGTSDGKTGSVLMPADEPLAVSSEKKSDASTAAAAPTEAASTPTAVPTEAATTPTAVPTEAATTPTAVPTEAVPTPTATPAPTVTPAVVTIEPTATPAPVPEPDPVLLMPAQITASSQLGYDGDNYYPEFVDDNSSYSAWAEGASGNGEGQSLFFVIPAGTKITGGNIMTGLHKNEDLFYKNSAPTQLLISSGGQSCVVDVSAYADTWPGSETSQTFSLPAPIISDGTVTVTIQAVRAGWKYTDTLISELHFYGVPAEYVQGNASGPTSSAGNNGEETAGLPAAGNQDGQPAKQLEEKETSRMTALAGWVYRRRMERSGPADAAIAEEDMSAEEKAFLLYWYQYMCGDTDSRIQGQMEYNAVSRTDLYTMMGELFGETGEEEMNAFFDKYVEWQDGDLCYMNGTGDFGDAGPFYFRDGVQTEENGRLCVTGNLYVFDSAAGSYLPQKTFRAYFDTSFADSGNGSIPYPFLEVIVG